MADPETQEVIKIKLDNGLTLLVLPDKRSEVACFIHWVKVGYFNESDDIIGISHFLEHLFFKGTKSRRMEEITDEIKRLGGYINAGTIYDHTYFYTVVPSVKIEKGIEIVADVIMNPRFPEAEIETEKSVVIEEIKKKLDSPDQLGFEKLVEMAFDSHRIRRFRIGSEEEIRRLKKNDVEEYYRKYYKPSNSILCVVGNINPETVAGCIRRFYKDWPDGNIPPEDAPTEAPQKFPKYRKITGDISQCFLKIGFHVPNVYERDFYSVNFAAAILGKGRSSRLYKTLKEDLALVDEIGTSIYADKEIGYLAVEAILKKENFAAAKAKIIEEILKLKKDAVSDAEMEKVSNIIETNYFADKEDVLGQAYNLAYFESLGDYSMAKEFLVKALSVGKDEILGCAGKIFKLSNLSLLEYTDEKLKTRTSGNFKMKSAFMKDFSGYFKEETAYEKPHIEKKRAKMEFPFSWLASHKSFPVETKKGPGDTALIIKRNSGIPTLSGAIYFPGGRLDENEKNCGITNLALRSSIKGSKSRSALKIASELESLGCSLRVEATADNFGYAFSVLSRNFSNSYSIISELLTAPTFDEQEVLKEKNSLKASILSRRDDMFRYPIDLCYKALFGIHPYGLARFGTEKSIDSISVGDVKTWHANYFDIAKMVFCAVGDTRENLDEEIFKPFSDVKGAVSKTARMLSLVVKKGVKESVEERKRNQTAFAMGFQTPGMSSEDYYALEVLQNLLSGMGGRLYMEVREKRGLAYTVAAFNISLLRTGAFIVYAATSPQNEKKAVDIILSEILKAAKDKIRPEEIRRARNYTIGSNGIALQTNMAQVYEYLRYYFVKNSIREADRFAEKINAVTEEDLKRVLDKYFNRNNYAIGVVRGE